MYSHTKIIYIIIIANLLLFVNCRPKVRPSDIRAKNALRLLELKIGMSREKALQVMGGVETITLMDRSNRNIHGKKIPNPYRSEIKTVGDRKLETVFYYTDEKKADNAITDDELTPLFFENGKLIGWGWSFFEDEINKYEYKLKVR